MTTRAAAQELVAEHRRVQNAAKAVLRGLADEIGSIDTEQSIAARAENALRSHGIRETWYHSCPALVLLGSRSCLSVSGRHYRPASEAVGETNLVTVDLSPSDGGYWGDCARSFFVERGRVTQTPSILDFANGAAFLRQLHSAMRAWVVPATTFHELAVWTTNQISAAGFENLDFRQNVGHSIARRREDRIYVTAGNPAPLGDVDFFTFEPHVRSTAGTWGFKHEDIFFFDVDGRLEAL